MDTVLNALRDILGQADFYQNNINGYSWNYGLMIEYIIAGIILMVCISSVFRFLCVLVRGK